MGGFVPQGTGVTNEDSIFEEPDVSHGKHLLDRCLPSLTCFHTLVGPCAAGAVSATFTSTKRAPSSPIPTRADTEVGGEKSGGQTGIYRGAAGSRRPSRSL